MFYLMRQKWKMIVSVCIISVLLAGCSCNVNQDSSADEKKQTTTVNPTKKEAEKAQSVFSITGYREYRDKTPMDNQGSAYMIAAIEKDSKVGDKYLFYFNVLMCNEKYITIEYNLAQEKIDYYNEIGPDDYFEHYVAVLSADTYEIVKEIKINEENSYISKNNENIFVHVNDDEKEVVTTYDYQLNKLSVIENDTNLGYITSDGQRTYYCEKKQLYVYNSADDTYTQLSSYKDFFVEYIVGVITDNDENDIVIFRGMAADYKEYQFIFDAATGHVVRMDDLQDNYSYVQGNSYVEYITNSEYLEQWRVGSDLDSIFDYCWNGEPYAASFYIMDNQDILFTYSEEDTMHFELFDHMTGELIGNMVLDVSEMRPSDEEIQQYNELYGEADMLDQSLVNVYMPPICIDTDTLLLCMQNISGNKYFLCWDYMVEDACDSEIEVVRHKIDDGVTIDISEFDNPLYQPEELEEEWQPLREQADELEKKFGVEIHIGDECGNILGGYVIVPLNDYDITSEALMVLEEEMEKYPDNFFAQFEYSNLEGIDIYLTSSLLDISDENLGEAGGFEITDESRIILTIDCRDPNSVRSVFHHELSHAIDGKIDYEMMDDDNPIFSEEQWEAYNPHVGIYTFSYNEWVQHEEADLAYEERMLTDFKLEETYFIDVYAMTFPTEDRARIFANVMSDYANVIDFDKAPHLTAKLNYYAQCIREAFDTAGWDNIYWERYME